MRNIHTAVDRELDGRGADEQPPDVRRRTKRLNAAARSRKLATPMPIVVSFQSVNAAMPLIACANP